MSEALTGQRPLRKRLAAQYLERFARTPDYYPKLKRHLEVHKQYAVGGGTPDDIADQIMGNKEPDADDIRAAAEQVIYLWHVSAFFLQALEEQPAAHRSANLDLRQFGAIRTSASYGPPANQKI